MQWIRRSLATIFAVVVALTLAFTFSSSVATAQDVLPNDDIADAIELTDFPFSSAPAVAGATLEDGERVKICARYPALSGSVWYRYTPEISDRVLVDGAQFRVYTSNEATPTVSDLDAQTCGGSSFYARAGQTHWIQIIGDPSTPLDTVTFDLRSSLRATLNVIVLIDGDVLPESYTVTAESFFGLCPSVTSVVDNPSGNDVVSLDVAVFQPVGGDCGYLVSADAGPTFAQISDQVGGPLQAGTGYSVVVQLLGRPANDRLANAEPVNLPVAFGPQLRATVDGLDCAGDRPTVWYSFVAESDFAVSTLDTGQVVGVYTADNPNPSVDDLVEVGCLGGFEFAGFDGVAGQTYYVAVTPGFGFGSASIQSFPNDGSLLVRLRAEPPSQGVPEQIEVLLRSEECDVERQLVVTDVTGTNQVEFTDLPRFAASGARCLYTVDTELPVGWTRSTRTIDLNIDRPTTVSLSYQNAPANTRLDSAEIIEVDRMATVDATTAPAAARDDGSCGFGPAVWFSWTAPADGELNLSSEQWLAAFGVHTSDLASPESNTDLDLVNCLYERNTDRLAVRSGETYWIGVEAFDANVTFELRFYRSGCAGLTGRASDGVLSGDFSIDAAGFVGSTNRASAASDYVFDADQSSVESCVDVKRAGTYYLWTEIAAPDVDSDSFWVVVDDGEPTAIYAPVTDPVAPVYLLDADDERIAIPLTEGPHSIRFVQREAGARLAGFELRPVRAGINPSDISLSCSFGSTPPDTIVQAESQTTTGTMLAQLNDFQVDGAAEGGYVGVPPWVPNAYSLDPRDAVEFCFYDNSYVDEPAPRYTLSARVLAPSESADSFFVQVGYNDPFIWHLEPAPSWIRQTIPIPGTLDPYELEAGDPIRVRIFARESGTLIDWLRLDSIEPDYSSYPAYPAKPGR